ncbi:hypothetical protein Aperf_G00000023387 [Anoplocephala perfoliata]
MDANKFLEMRKHIEENNQDMIDILGDFDQWKADVERKSAKMRAEVTGNEMIPPVRNILHKKRKKKGSSSKKGRNKQDRIKSYDYKAWDSFDVDKALADVDKSESEESGSKSETDEEWENERRMKLSEIEKDQGNTLFKEGKYAEAIEKYTTAIRLAPENSLLYTNRALALCKLDRYASAEADCSIALNINPKLVKGLYRRAQARKALGKLEEAISDLKRILDIEPRNSAALKDLAAWTGETNLRAGSVNSLYKLIDVAKAVNSSGLRRIQISEVGGEVRQKIRKQIETSKSSSSANAASGDGSAQMNTPLAMPKKEPPVNWFQLERDLRELTQSGDSLTPQAVDYLCSIEPKDYETVIGGSLTSSCLGNLITAMNMSSNLSSAQKAERMTALAELPRFNVAWMLAEDSDRETVHKLLQEVPSEYMESLKTLFA